MNTNCHRKPHERKGDSTKNVLWISRHEMTPPQRRELDRILADTVQIVQWKDTVNDFDPLIPLIAQADAIAAVLPTELMAQLLKIAGKKPVLQALSERRPTGRIVTTPDGRQEAEFAFFHRGWEQILQINIETRLL